MIQRKILVTALLMSGLVTSANAEFVHCVNCGTETTLQRVLSAVGQAQDRIVNAIQGSSTAQTAATSESARVVAEANTKTAAEMKKAEIQIQAVPLDPCGVTAVARGGSAASNNRPASSGRGTGTPTPTKGATSDMVDALDIANGVKPAPPQELAATIAANGACGTFAQGTLREADCKGAGFATGLSSGFPNADIKAETIFDGPQNASDIAAGVNRKLTIKPGNSTEKMAVNAFISNIAGTVPLKTLNKNEINSLNGRSYMALRDSFDASISLANKPLRDQEGLITANKTTIPIVDQMMKGQDSSYISKHLQQVFPSWRTDGISYAELLNLEASRRYLNPDWHARMAGATEKQLMVEQVEMQALQGWMQASTLERLQQIAILQGTVAGAAIRTEKLPKLTAAHQAAKLPG